MDLLEQLFQLFGRLHPMVLHAPIGLLIGLVIIEILSALTKKPLPREVRTWLTWLVVLSAAGSIATGLVLRREGGYGSETVDWHQWLGIALGVCCLLAAVVQQFGKVVWYRAVLSAVAVLAIPVGHYGASLTHGGDFLTSVFSPKPANSVDPSVTMPVATSEYALIIAPILQTRCVGCHSEKKAKGDLRLDSPEGIAAGGEFGPVLVAMKPGESEILTRLRLPLKDDEHMPPSSKPQPDAKEIAAIESWIARGASFTEPMGAAAVATSSNTSTVPAPVELKSADPAAIEALRAALVHVSQVSQGSKLLLVDFSAVASKIDDAQFTRLVEPVALNIEQLNAARTKISDASMDIVAKMTRLKRLDIGFTSISDDGLSRITVHQPLEELVVPKTMVSSLLAIDNMPALRRIFCWGSMVTPERVAQVREQRTGLIVDSGEAAQAALETEPPPVLAAKPKPAADTAPAPVADLKPVNTICPVSGKPIDPTKLVVYKGKVIAMCCEHCAEAFLADPEKFADKIGK